ncbi:MAG: hypothetical protein DMF56_25915 [Acidobacteria bacterium]|nr:MAG: hypothetical protein DMF56_25915 [Acidobacteriota bacterium]
MQADAPLLRDNVRVGIALWLSCGVVTFLIARLVPFARRNPWVELGITLLAALALGVLATALDFAGWNEPDWRAGLFAFCGSFAAAGAVRALQSLATSNGGPS